jgi:hypothetical protein
VRFSFDLGPFCLRLCGSYNAVSFGIGNGILGFGFDTGNCQGTLLLFDAVLVFPVDVGRFNLCVECPCRQLTIVTTATHIY